MATLADDVGSIERSTRDGRRAAIAVATVGAIALAVRLVFAIGPRTGLDSDEAIVGLMAFRLLHHGEIPPAFYWHQNYGGSLEAVLVAPFIWMFGTTTLGLRTVSVLFELVTAALSWRVARRLFRSNVAAFVGVAALFWPLALVWFGTRERGFYPLSTALGMTVVLCALRIDEHPGAPANWFTMGLAGGVGWWMSPNIVYYAAPIGLWLAVRGHVRQVRNVALAGVACAFGAGIWIAATVQRHFTTLHGPLAPSSTYTERFGVFWRQALPFALGLRRGNGHWYGSAALGVALVVATLVVGVAALSRIPVITSPEVFLLAASPFVFAAFYTNSAVSGDGRYTYFVASLLPLLLGRMMSIPVGRVIVAALLIVSTVGFVRDYPRVTRAIPGSTRALAARLRAAGFHTATGDYWSTFKMTFESGERIIASPLPGQHGARSARYAAIVAASTPAYVFEATGSSHAIAALDAELRGRHIAFREITAGWYAAVLPDTYGAPHPPVGGVVP